MEELTFELLWRKIFGTVTVTPYLSDGWPYIHFHSKNVRANGIDMTMNGVCVQWDERLQFWRVVSRRFHRQENDRLCETEGTKQIAEICLQYAKSMGKDHPIFEANWRAGHAQHFDSHESFIEAKREEIRSAERSAELFVLILSGEAARAPVLGLPETERLEARYKGQDVRHMGHLETVTHELFVNGKGVGFVIGGKAVPAADVYRLKLYGQREDWKRP